MSGQYSPGRGLISWCRILMIGNAMRYHFWRGAVSRMSPKAPVTVVGDGRPDIRSGGTAYVVLSIISFGARATLISMVREEKVARSPWGMRKVHGNLGIDSDIDTLIKLRAIGRARQILRSLRPAISTGHP